MILEILSNIIKEHIDTDIMVKKSNRPDLCDYQFDGIFKLASESHKNPIELGEELVKNINDRSDFNEYFKKVEFVKPGFINMTIS